MADNAGWSVKEQLVEAATLPFMQVGSTEVVEDGFRALRHAEQHESSAKKVISCKRKWTTLIDSALERQVHRYAPLHFASETLPRGARLACRLGESSGTSGWVGAGPGDGGRACKVVFVHVGFGRSSRVHAAQRSVAVSV